MSLFILVCYFGLVRVNIEGIDVGGGGVNFILCFNVIDKDMLFCCEKIEMGRCCDDGIG